MARTFKKGSATILAIAVAIGAGLLLLSVRHDRTESVNTGSSLEQGDYSVVLENDYGFPATVTVFATLERSPIVHDLGLLTAGELTTFTLTPGKQTYTFNLVAEEGGKLYYISSVMSENRLIERGFHVKLLADDMQAAAFPPTYIPPMPTDDPVLVPSPETLPSQTGIATPDLHP